jgi:hypothetical protein
VIVIIDVDATCQRLKCPKEMEMESIGLKDIIDDG